MQRSPKPVEFNRILRQHADRSTTAVGYVELRSVLDAATDLRFCALQVDAHLRFLEQQHPEMLPSTLNSESLLVSAFRGALGRMVLTPYPAAGDGTPAPAYLTSSARVPPWAAVPTPRARVVDYLVSAGVVILGVLAGGGIAVLVGRLFGWSS